MAKKRDSIGEDMKETLAKPSPAAQKEEVITLRFKEAAYWRGEFKMRGDTLDLPRSEAEKTLHTYGYFEAAGK